MDRGIAAGLAPATREGRTLVCAAFGPGTCHLRYQSRRGRSPLEPLPATRFRRQDIARGYMMVEEPGDPGSWLGINDASLVVAATRWKAGLESSTNQLQGAELLRLALEESETADHAADLLIDLISRYGQRCGNPAHDHIFLAADSRRGYIIEAADRYWAMQEVGSVRAVTGCAMIHQDWNRIAPGLAELLAKQQLWTCDGSKLNFAGTLRGDMVSDEEYRRWGKVSLVLEETAGSIDLDSMRNLVDDAADGEPPAASAVIAESGSDAIPAVLWLAYRFHNHRLWLPLVPTPSFCFDSQLTRRWMASEQLLIDAWSRLAAAATRPSTIVTDAMQERIDESFAEFRNEAIDLASQCSWSELVRLRSLLVCSHLEQLDKLTSAENSISLAIGLPAQTTQSS